MTPHVQNMVNAKNCAQSTHQVRGSSFGRNCSFPTHTANRMLWAVAILLTHAQLISSTRCHDCDRPLLNASEHQMPSCEVGFFGILAPDEGCKCVWACSPCAVCGVGYSMFLNYEIQRCHGTHNTLCCYGDNYVLIERTCVYNKPINESTAVQSKTATPGHEARTYNSKSDNNGIGTHSFTNSAPPLNYPIIAVCALVYHIHFTEEAGD